jgi:hypothetical protein
MFADLVIDAIMQSVFATPGIDGFANPDYWVRQVFNAYQHQSFGDEK